MNYLLDTNICIYLFRGQVGEFDLLIGTTAMTHGLTLVTRNTRDFENLDRIKLENWID